MTYHTAEHEGKYLLTSQMGTQWTFDTPMEREWFVRSEKWFTQAQSSERRVQDLEARVRDLISPSGKVSRKKVLQLVKDCIAL